MSEMESQNETKGALRLALSARQGTFSQVDPVVVDVILTNTGDIPLTVNARFLLNSGVAPNDAREIAININGPPGYFSLIKFQVNAGPPSTEHFVKLLPGGEIKKSFELTKYFSLHLPGRYEIRATYSNISGVDQNHPEAWTGTLTSNTIVLQHYVEDQRDEVGKKVKPA